MNKAYQSKKEARRQARLERRAQEEERRRRAQRSRTLTIAGVAAVVVVIIGWFVWGSVSRGSRGPATPASQPAQTGQPPRPRPQIVTVKDQGRDHVTPGQPHPAYNSNPPASGWHYGTTTPWGFHTEVLQDELVIHNLEHGGIWITYKDENDSAVVDPLVALAREFPRKLIISHRPQNDSRIAVVAWDHVMKLDAFDRDAIVDFYNRFKNKGPEFVPD